MFAANLVSLQGPAQPALFVEDQMSIQTSFPSALAFRRTARGTGRHVSADRHLVVAAALFVGVLIAEALFIAAATPSLTDIGSLYVTTT